MDIIKLDSKNVLVVRCEILFRDKDLDELQRHIIEQLNEGVCVLPCYCSVEAIEQIDFLKLKKFNEK